MRKDNLDKRLRVIEFALEQTSYDRGHPRDALIEFATVNKLSLNILKRIVEGL